MGASGVRSCISWSQLLPSSVTLITGSIKPKARPSWVSRALFKAAEAPREPLQQTSIEFKKVPERIEKTEYWVQMSLEALAMAGVDWAEYGQSIEEWEREGSEMQPPPHLLADTENDDDDEKDEEDICGGLDEDVEGLVSRCTLELGKFLKLGSFEDEILESFNAWWSSKRGCLGGKMELKQLKMDRFIQTLERLGL